ncbi:MAG: circadian clock KaiB family protein [Candidatus Anammoxibacter sp.]
MADKNIVIETNNVCETENDAKLFFKLFIAGQASEYSKIIEGLRNIFDKHLQYYELEVINVIRNPELAERDNIIATPTIVKCDNYEPLMIIGDMSNSERVLSGLNIIRNKELCELEASCAGAVL